MRPEIGAEDERPAARRRGWAGATQSSSAPPGFLADRGKAMGVTTHFAGLRGPQGATTAGSVDDVRLVEAALFDEGLLDEKYTFDGSFGSKTLSAYAAWQRRSGHADKIDNGLPALESLKALGRKYGFSVRA
jgi:hypothetical protein